MFTSHLFNLDPSHPSFKKTKATQSIVAEKQRRREEEQRRLEGAQEVTQAESDGKSREAESDARATTTQMDPSLSLLVRSIKSKTQQFQARKKQKLV
uniref:NUC153 domain-containing protein n=1 Tax=Neolamprologus brichardi TaxID=32507 RepID=A0A3Q4GEI3_NEOBR